MIFISAIQPIKSRLGKVVHRDFYSEDNVYVGTNVSPPFSVSRTIPADAQRLNKHKSIKHYRQI